VLQERSDLVRETFKGTPRFKGLEAWSNSHSAEIEQRRVGRRRQLNVTALTDFLLHRLIHAREVEVERWVVWDSDSGIRDVLQRKRNSVAKGGDDCLAAGHFCLGKDLVPGIGVQRARSCLVADSRDKRLLQLRWVSQAGDGWSQERRAGANSARAC
jgi:hypothetical protein